MCGCGRNEVTSAGWLEIWCIVSELFLLEEQFVLFNAFFVEGGIFLFFCGNQRFGSKEFFVFFGIFGE